MHYRRQGVESRLEAKRSLLIDGNPSLVSSDTQYRHGWSIIQRRRMVKLRYRETVRVD